MTLISLILITLGNICFSNVYLDLDASPQDGDNAGELPECESGPEAGKMVRNKRKPTRFEDCMLDLSEVGEISQPEVLIVELWITFKLLFFSISLSLYDSKANKQVLGSPEQ